MPHPLKKQKDQQHTDIQGITVHRVEQKGERKLERKGAVGERWGGSGEM